MPTNFYARKKLTTQHLRLAALEYAEACRAYDAEWHLHPAQSDKAAGLRHDRHWALWRLEHVARTLYRDGGVTMEGRIAAAKGDQP